MTYRAFDPSQKWFGVPPRFDPERGDTVFVAPEEGYGYWAGAPSAAYDPDAGCFYLYYRRRWPLHEGRGAECCIARSDDGVHFENTSKDVGRCVLKRAQVEDGRVIHEHVDPTVGGQRILDDAGPILFTRHVESREGSSLADLGSDLFTLRDEDVGEHDLRAGGGERSSNG